MKLFRYLVMVLLTYPVFGQENYVTLQDNTKLYVEETGEGETLLFIPGWTMTHRFFTKQKEHFSKSYHVITYDPRGQGRSDKTTYKNTYLHHANDLRELIIKIVMGCFSPTGCAIKSVYLEGSYTLREHCLSQISTRLQCPFADGRRVPTLDALLQLVSQARMRWERGSL